MLGTVGLFSSIVAVDVVCFYLIYVKKSWRHKIIGNVLPVLLFFLISGFFEIMGIAKSTGLIESVAFSLLVL